LDMCKGVCAPAVNRDDRQSLHMAVMTLQKRVGDLLQAISMEWESPERGVSLVAGEAILNMLAESRNIIEDTDYQIGRVQAWVETVRRDLGA